MKNENKFSVSRFNNRNGVPSWRVAGWLKKRRLSDAARCCLTIAVDAQLEV